ncbi:MAG: glucose-1-phosphate adenylyltransferase family protein [Candidatus Eisenbacteria bacterium]|nr:sugar phosphate nucleotidyltransferase [Candidatus Eisenbacteria bacterium]
MTPPRVDMRRTLALLLAGGEGSRLNCLVHRRAKPAVPFGAIYRIIDFALSNVMHSGLERVGILTQYMPYSLSDHIGTGESWGMIGRNREARILPPHLGQRASDWYRGTADAIYRNLSYIDRYNSDLCLILSGDHVYQMDYAPMVAEHIRAGADATIAVREIPIEEASSFGTVLVDSTDRITGFEEKPEKPRSGLISMGIYVFSRKVLVRELEEIVGHQGLTDFGKHIFPAMLEEGCHLQAFRFRGYWQDVGTIRAYFESHMEMLAPDSPIDLERWRVRTNRNEETPGDRQPARFDPSAHVERSIIAAGTRIAGDVRNSILSPGVVVEAGAVVERSVLMHDTRIGARAHLRDAILDKQVEIGPEAVVGGIGDMVPNRRFPTHLDSGQVLIGKGARVPAGAVIERNTILFPDVSIPRTAGTVHSGETIGDLDP